MLNFSFCGIELLFMLFSHRYVSGIASCSEHFESRIAGNPSGPEADEGFNSLMASTISSGLTVMFDIVSVVLLVYGGGVDDGVLKTELYCSARMSAILFESLVMVLVALSSKGPTFVFTFLLFFA